jgi:hypothetical protein
MRLISFLTPKDIFNKIPGRKRCLIVKSGVFSTTLIFTMTVFFLSKKENMLVPNAVEKHRMGAFRTRDQTLSFFFSLKKKKIIMKNESSQGSLVRVPGD